MKIDEGNSGEGIFIPYNGELLRVPARYLELLELTPFIHKEVSHDYLVWGRERYETGSKEYQRPSPWGETNACYLPETDTLKDVEEELLDAMFNVMVLYWKDNGGSDKDQENPLHNLNDSIIDALYWAKQMRDIKNGN